MTADPNDVTNPFTALSGAGFGVDFNPVADRLRVVSDVGQNLRINPATGQVITDADINPSSPNVAGSAYTNNFAGATTTALFGLEAASNRLVAQNPPNNGTIATIGTTLGAGIDFNNSTGFDIVTAGGGTSARIDTAFASLSVAGSFRLYSVNLTAGTASLIGSIGSGATPIVGLAVIPAGTLNFSVDSFAESENSATATITVTRSSGSAGAVSVDVSASPGAAALGSDFDHTLQTIQFADGDTAPKTFTVTLLDDLLAEGYESLSLSLSNATNGSAIGATGKSTLTIRDNESPSLTMYAVDNNNRNLLEFDPATPGTIRQTSALVGLNPGDIVQGIDVRPLDGNIYALITNSATSRLATINPSSGAVMTVANLTADPADATNPFTTLVGSDFGIDFNATTDRLRIVSDAEENLSVNPTNGLVTTQTAVTGGTPNVVGSAYTNSFVGAGTSSLYAIDSGTDSLYRQDPAANGLLTLVGPLGVNFIDNTGFEINAAGNQAFASLIVAGQTVANLFSINLFTGAATIIGKVGSGFVINGLTSANTPVSLDAPTAVLQPDPTLPGKQMLVITGTSNDDTITVTHVSGQTKFSVALSNVVPALVFSDVTGRIVVNGFEGNDTISISSKVAKPTVLNGGEGNDTIFGGKGRDIITGGAGDDSINGGRGEDRLVESGDVDMILTSGNGLPNGSLAGGLGNDVLLGKSIEIVQLTGGPGANILNAANFRTGRVILFGSGGNDELRGGDKNDVLIGGTGQDILFGGKGRDLLVGGLELDELDGGLQDDILIGGTTTHDGNVAALEAIMREWTRGIGYATRIAHLLGTVPPSASGGIMLNTTTVTGDGVANKLTGGSERDWFFEALADITLDPNVGGAETVTTLP